jgi:F420-non-reducing hydrogenase iron-sulfur subunit
LPSKRSSKAGRPAGKRVARKSSKAGGARKRAPAKKASKAKKPKARAAKKTRASAGPKRRAAAKAPKKRTSPKKPAAKRARPKQAPGKPTGKKAAPSRSKAEAKAEFEPRIVAFACNWCSYPAADAAGISKMQYPPNARVIRVMCAGRIHPAFVLRALELGADGVLVSGCHFEDCHYLFGAKRAAEQYEKAAALVKILGLEPERVRYEQISAAEAPKFARVMREFVDEIKKVGPTRLGAPGEIEVPDAVSDERT